MYFKRWALIVMFLTVSAHSHAQDPKPRPCLSSIPESLQSTVEQDNWKILQPQDIPSGDLPTFKGNHPGQCPGVTAGNFYPKTKSSFVVALIQRDDEKHVTEKILLVTQRKNKIETAIVTSPAQVTALSVVWRIPPGHWRGIDGKNATIKRDSFVSEQIFSSATQYYYDGSHLKSLMLSK